jgi:hypothetical protein
MLTALLNNKQQTAVFKWRINLLICSTAGFASVGSVERSLLPSCTTVSQLMCWRVNHYSLSPARRCCGGGGTGGRELRRPPTCHRRKEHWLPYLLPARRYVVCGVILKLYVNTHI